MFYQLSLVGSILIGLVAILAAALGFVIAKQVVNDPKKKALEDKVLLKELLEGFGLEVPSELKEAESGVIKSIKTP